MTKFMLVAGAAAMALAAPGLAQKGGHGGGGNPHAQGGGDNGGNGGNGGDGNGGGNGRGHGGGGNGGAPMIVVGGGGGGHGNGGGGFARMERGGGGGHGNANGGGERFARQGGGHTPRVHEQRRIEQRATREQRGRERVAMRDNRRAERAVEPSRSGQFVRDHGRAIAVAGAATGAAAFAGSRYTQYNGQRVMIDGCPPGLAAKDNGCMPPGQLKQQWGYGAPLRQDYANAYLPGLYRSWYPDNDQYYYRYGDGYAYRVERSDNLVDGLFPLMGTGYYAPGDVYPAAYDVYNIPQPYQGYYPDNGDDYYRYNDGAIYQVNRSSGVVESIVALLTGGLGGGLGGGGLGGGGLGGIGSALGGLGGLGIGQQLPAGYDVYNVPDAYRDRYYDNPDANYRYANGSIYQVDPKTQLIQQIISALV